MLLGSNLKGCPLRVSKTPPLELFKLRSDLRSERSKTNDSLAVVTEATSLRGVSTQAYCYTVPKKKEKLPLSVTHPELAKEADGWDTSEYLAGSHTKVNWKCRRGHKWDAAINTR